MNDKEFPIAIVGYAYRAPGISAGESLWDYLAEAKSAWTRVPSDRFDQDAYYHSNPEKAGTFAVQGAHFLTEDVHRFDAPFFNLRAEEARAIDPQHRMLLECAFEAVDHAGLRLVDLAGSETGVFSAIASGDYGQQMADDPMSASNCTATGTAPTMFANRLSYFFDLIGPSVSLDTACASSGYAIHMACQSLRLGECKTALVGGASLLLGPYQFTILDTMGALSPKGRCYSYDRKAAGFGRGEGAACMVLKPLAQAVADGDPVQAVIRSSACNHSGRSDGITMPSKTAQVKLLRKVHEQVGLSPADTPVVEGHGTGTLVGDRIELGAFAEVFTAERTPSNPLYVGSLKSNFGHLECASGILALTKAVLMVQRGCMLPNADFEQLGPAVEGHEKLKVLQAPEPWPVGISRRACMTNFGFGGSNAAVLIEDLASLPVKVLDITNASGASGTADGVSHDVAHQHRSQDERPQKDHVFVLSAHSESSLVSHCSALLNYLTDHSASPDQFLKDLSFTLGQRRTQHAWRLAFTASSLEQLTACLSYPSTKPAKARHPLLAYAFTGQGAQYPQMALELWSFPAFETSIHESDRHLKAFGTSWSLEEEIKKLKAESRIDNAELSQPACTAIQLGLVTLLRSWGLTPAVVTGHSSGEIAAAFAAGFLTLEAAMAISYFRGQAAARLTAPTSVGPRGGMLALGISAEDAAALLAHNTEGYATIAAINSSRSVTISGDEVAIQNVQDLAEAQGLFVRRLKVRLAYHSAHMESVAESYRELIEPFCEKTASSQNGENISGDQPIFISSLMGMPVDAKAVNASYWVQNLLKPVRFLDAIRGVQNALEDAERVARRRGTHVILEVGPHAALKTPIQQILSERHQQQKCASPSVSSYLPTLTRGIASDHALANLVGKLFCLGFDVKLGNVNHTHHGNSSVLTDLPRYSWDRSARYVHQSRVAKAKLHPGVPYDPLVGWKSPSADGSEHVFRQIFTLDDLSWIREHKVNGIVIFPMTGYLAMAISAARSITAKPPVFLTLTDVHTKRRLEVAEDERIEMTTKLWPAETGTESASATTWAFKISSWTEKRGWKTHCHGQIEPEAHEMHADTPTFQASLELMQSCQRVELDPEIEYGGRTGVGTTYGDAYRVMQRFWKGDGWTEMESRMRNANWASLSSRFGSPVTTDAPSLDAHLQGMAPFVGDTADQRPALMPTYVSRLRIGNAIPADNDSQRFSIVTRCLEQDMKAGSTKVGVAVFARCFEDGKDEPLLVPVAEWESVSFRSLLSVEDDPINNLKAPTLPYSFYWDHTPSLDFINDAMLTAMQGTEVYNQREVEERRLLNNASLHYMVQAVKELATTKTRVELPVHSAGFLTWATETVRQYGSPAAARSDTMMSVSALLEVSNSSARGELICAIGEQLVPILRGEVQPLEIMLKDNLLWRQYEEDTPTQRLSHAIGHFTRELLHVRGRLRVLEIGAGTGSATRPLLDAFSHGGSEDERKLLDYTYTDISSGFFDTARDKLDVWASSITYKKLDIGQDPLFQGFEASDYDLVIAANVLHATANMSSTMEHVRKLLKPNGKLILLEALVHAPLTMPFALLPGWWLSEDKYRDLNMGPLMTTKAWDGLLTDCGFSGVEGIVHDFPEHADQLLGLMCSAKISQTPDGSDLPITICGAIRDGEEEKFADLVAEQAMERLGCDATVKPFAELDTDDDPVCILLDSPSRSILHVDEMSPEAYEIIRNMMITTKALLWVIPEDHAPEHDIVRGILRSLRLEDVSGRLLLLENVPWTGAGASVIVNLIKRLQDPDLARDLDQDFLVHDDQLYVARLRPLATADLAFAAATNTVTRIVQPIWQDDAALELTLDAVGSPDFIFFRRNSKVLTVPLAADDILIRNEAVGVNFRDLLVVLGSIPWTPPGFEGVGVVIRKGSNVSEFQVGDRVCYGSLTGGSYATCLRVPSWHAFKIPEHLKVEEAAGISTPYSTAVMALVQIGRLRRGESVLIHAASGGVGQACIVLAKHIGATIFVTAGSADKRAFLHKTMGVSEKHIFSSRTSDFRDSIMHATKGRGIDVIVNSLSGKLLHDTWALVAESGRFIEIGKKDVLQNSHLAMRHFERNVTFRAVDLRMLFERRPEEMKDCLAQVVDLLHQKVIVPIYPQTVLPVSQLATGLRKLQSGQNIGKIVITISPEDRVLAECAPKLHSTSPLLRRDATYVLTGGTGGIGRSLAPWMFENGAGNVVLLGRSGANNPEVARLLQRYENDPNVKLQALACDVGSRENLIQALELIKSLPPVRGVVHGALWIRDAFLSNSSYEDWQKTVTPKIPAAWNLHELLPDLDFFISLGSFLGACGNAGQTIYSGTSSFLDAFTTFRNRQGLPSVSIALPIVLGVGYVADRAREEEMTDRVGMTLTEAQVQTLVHGAILGPSSGLNHNGVSSSFNLPPNVVLHGEWFHPRNLMRLILDSQLNKDSASPGAIGSGDTTSQNENGAPLGLLDALIQKVSSMTMIDQKEIEPLAPLNTYGLDSLVSVELRNWIRRETGVELSLAEISSGESLAALAESIASLRRK